MRLMTMIELKILELEVAIRRLFYFLAWAWQHAGAIPADDAQLVN